MALQPWPPLSLHWASGLCHMASWPQAHRTSRHKMTARMLPLTRAMPAETAIAWKVQHNADPEGHTQGSLQDGDGHASSHLAWLPLLQVSPKPGSLGKHPLPQLHLRFLLLGQWAGSDLGKRQKATWIQSGGNVLHQHYLFWDISNL